ncbi:D-aminoacyl-tRNA deacylase [Porphyromonas levii]|uniref:TatD family hydrolase n=1 Tax=Porphyromonas levii TaxID=28114 RepID=UPI00201343EF|nr:TatD family hydrolase [Porphyromonas levii]MBR8763922.1 D-aminoacyl-tRNA deacylase [Porphyromonas levii]
MMHPLVDTHTHLYYADEEERLDFSRDIDQVITRAIDAEVGYFLLPNIDRASYPKMMALCKRYPKQCYPMIGLHPTDVGEDWEEQLAFLYSELQRAPERYVAVGEIGLDYHWELEYKEEMIEAFRRQLDWALEYNLPVSVHSRDAEEDTIAILSGYASKGLRGSLHSFGGNEAQLLLALTDCPSFMIGINGVITFKNNPNVVIYKNNLPLDRVLIETDAPFLSPVPHRGKRNEPSYLHHIVAKLSEMYGMGVPEVRQQLFVNSIKMFNLHTQTIG